MIISVRTELLMDSPVFLNCFVFLHLPPTCSSSAKCPVFIFLNFSYNDNLSIWWTVSWYVTYAIFYESINFHPCNPVTISISRHLVKKYCDIWSCRLVLAFRKCFQRFQNIELYVIRCCVAYTYCNAISECHCVIISPWSSFKII